VIFLTLQPKIQDNNILSIFLFCVQFQLEHSYKIYSYKKSVYVDIIFRFRATLYYIITKVLRYKQGPSQQEGNGAS